MTSVTLVKKSFALGAKPKPFAPHMKGSLDFQLVDNGDTTCTVRGIDKAGNPVDIFGVATIAVTSSDPSKVTVDLPKDLTFGMHAVGPLTASPVVINTVATWNDGSLGPFSFDLNVTTVAGPAGDIMVVPGDVTMH